MEEARQWFDREFIALECDVASPIGKVLSADRVLSVAKYSGVRRFREEHAWAEEFARNTASLLGREYVRVDIPNYSVGTSSQRRHIARQRVAQCDGGGLAPVVLSRPRPSDWRAWHPWR